MLRLTNISKGPIVCDLKDKSTLRISVKKSKDISESNITPHIERLVKSGQLTCRTLETPKKETAVKAAVKTKKGGKK